MREVDEQLELMKDEYKRRMDFCEERRLLFEAKQAKMRDNVIKFEKFIQVNVLLLFFITNIFLAHVCMKSFITSYISLLSLLSLLSLFCASNYFFALCV